MSTLVLRLMHTLRHVLDWKTGAFRKFVVQFRSNDGGAIAILFALLLAPLMIMAGAAIDYARAARVRTNFNVSLDTATLAVARVASDELRKGNYDWMNVAIKSGKSFFAANNADGVDKNAAAAPRVVFNVSVANGVVTSTGRYDGEVPMSFMKVAGVDALAVRGQSTASLSAPRYVDFHIVVDVSPSMGIGATRDDQIKMLAAIGCQFACHFNDIYGRKDDVAKARASGARLRVDVIRESIAAALVKLPTDGTARVALYTFSNTLKTYLPLTSDIAAAANAAAAIELAGEPDQGGTNLNYSLRQLAASLAQTGDGLSAAKPKGVVVVGTDGVEDSVPGAPTATAGITATARDPNFTTLTPNMTMWSVMTVQGMSPTSCDALKSKGYSVLTVQSKYITSSDLRDDIFFDYIDKTLGPQIDGAMAACASAANYAFVATSPSEIQQAFFSAIGLGVSLHLK